MSKPINESGLGRVDLFFDLISQLGIDTPELLLPYMEVLHGDFELRPLAEQLIDTLLGEDPTRYSVYRSIRARRSEELYGVDSGAGENYRQVGVFMTRCIKLEGTSKDA